jgi:galactose mutarotase-like enzyme
MRIHRLQNDLISLAVSESGAELKSLNWLQSGREWMWQASPEFWPRTAPVLFPVVGKLCENQFSFDGKKYPLSQHGFARDMPFELAESGADFLRFRLRANEQSLRHYPFRFSLSIEYRLIDSSVCISFTVENEGRETMPFSIGAHPGFSLPSWPSKKYWLEFEKDEPLQTILLQDGLISDGKGMEITAENRLIEISKDLFLQDALIFSGLKSAWIGIRDMEGKEQLRVNFKGFPFLGIWSKPGAAFVCIEPWFGHADPVGFTGDIEKKPGINLLKPGEIFECSFSIDVIKN